MQRKISIILFILITGALAWTACDKIDDPLVVVDQKEYPENPDDTLYFVDSVNVTQRQVLLEDFTGHFCVNCPEAAHLAHGLAEEYDPRLVIYSVHAGQFAIPDPNSIFSDDFRSPLSEKLYTDFGIFANPIAQINRVDHGGLLQIFLNDWEAVATEQLGLDNVANIHMVNTYFPKLNSVVIDINAEVLQDLEGEYKLVVYLAEDSIVAPQLNNDPTIGGDTLYNYVHHNVLRAAVNSAYGEFLGDNGDVVPNIPYTFRYTFPLQDEWVTRHCNIIAYIGKADPTYNLIDIIQVAELGIKTE